MGLKLYQTFLRAGLPAPQMILGARIEGGPNSPAYEYVAQTVRSVLPMMQQFGIAKAEEVQIETLAQRLRDEVTSGGGVIVIPPIRRSMGTQATLTVIVPVKMPNPQVAAASQKARAAEPETVRWLRL